MHNVCLVYEPYVGIRAQFLGMLKKFLSPRIPAYATVCHRMPPCLKRIQPMHNEPLAYVSICQRISDIFHTLVYASTIRCGVTAPSQNSSTCFFCAPCDIFEIRPASGLPCPGYMHIFWTNRRKELGYKVSDWCETLYDNSLLKEWKVQLV